jgi:uncharacterized small protein (DUF1192 family)
MTKLEKEFLENTKINYSNPINASGGNGAQMTESKPQETPKYEETFGTVVNESKYLEAALTAVQDEIARLKEELAYYKNGTRIKEIHYDD